MAADVDDVIHPPGYLVETVRRAQRSVTGEIITCRYRSSGSEAETSTGNERVKERTWKRLEVRLQEALLVSMDTASHAGPRLADAQGPAHSVTQQNLPLETHPDTHRVHTKYTLKTQEY